MPPTYVFEDLRGVLLDHVLRADLMLTGLGAIGDAERGLGFDGGAAPKRSPHGCVFLATELGES